MRLYFSGGLILTVFRFFVRLLFLLITPYAAWAQSGWNNDAGDRTLVEMERAYARKQSARLTQLLLTPTQGVDLLIDRLFRFDFRVIIFDDQFIGGPRGIKPQFQPVTDLFAQVSRRARQRGDHADLGALGKGWNAQRHK